MYLFFRVSHYRGLDGTFATSQSTDSLPEHAYAVPARVVEMSSESLTSLESGSTGFTLQSAVSSGKQLSPNKKVILLVLPWGSENRTFD